MCFTGPFGPEMTTAGETGFFPRGVLCKNLAWEISARKTEAKAVFLPERTGTSKPYPLECVGFMGGWCNSVGFFLSNLHPFHRKVGAS